MNWYNLKKPCIFNGRQGWECCKKYKDDTADGLCFFKKAVRERGTVPFPTSFFVVFL